MIKSQFHLLNEMAQLPEAQSEIADFVAFLKTRHQIVKQQPQITKGDKNIGPSGLFGI